MPETESDKRARLARLMRATAKSPYLKWIAADARLEVEFARKLLVGTADRLDPRAFRSRAESQLDEDPAPTQAPHARTAPAKPGAPGEARRAPASAAGKRMILNTDGASRGNPGLAGAGAYLTLPDGTVVGAYRKFLGEGTNNYAEYRALILGLEEAAKAGAAELEVRADSELMVRQLTGQYKVKHPDIKQLVEIVRAKERRFSRVTYRHIPREENMIADRLSNEAIDER